VKFVFDAACETYKENGHAVLRQLVTFIPDAVWVVLYGQPGDFAVLTVICGRCNLLASPATRDARCIWFGRNECLVVSLISVCSLLSFQSVTVFLNFIHCLVLRWSTVFQKLLALVFSGESVGVGGPS
jgi:hypothetical protein